MNGIERLRDFARHMKDFSVWPGGQKLLDIADLIEREMCDLSSERLADSSDYADLQGEVFSVCQSLGVELEEGDTGSQALTRLYKAVTYLPFVRQSMDNIEQEIKDGVNSIAERLGIRDEIQVISIAKVCPRIVEELDRRLMPEGCEWPRYEDGEPVRFEDELPEFSETIYKTVKTVLFQNNGCIVIENNGGSANRRLILWKNERVKRPAVLAADGEPLEVGQTVWNVEDGTEWCVKKVKDGKVFIAFEDFAAEECDPSLLTHQRPVLAADGKPLREGEHVYHVETGAELVVKELPKPGAYQAVVVFAPPASHLTSFDPDQLTHTKPEPPDSWERIEEDAGKSACTYFCHSDVTQPPNCGHDVRSCRVDMTKDLVRRCRALAEKGER